MNRKNPILEQLDGFKRVNLIDGLGPGAMPNNVLKQLIFCRFEQPWEFMHMSIRIGANIVVVSYTSSSYTSSSGILYGYAKYTSRASKLPHILN